MLDLPAFLFRINKWNISTRCWVSQKKEEFGLIERKTVLFEQAEAEKERKERS